jgi:hypothetical protein
MKFKHKPNYLEMVISMDINSIVKEKPSNNVNSSARTRLDVKPFNTVEAAVLAKEQTLNVLWHH